MNGLSKLTRLMAFSAMFGLLTGGIAMAEIKIPSGIGLEKNMFFMAPTGDPVQVKAGMYEVDQAEHWLKLTPIGGERYDSILIEAKEATHEEDLSMGKAFLMPPSTQHPELQHLLLYLPSGTAYEAVGSQNGVWPRGFGSLWKKTKGAAKKVGSGVKKVGKGVKYGAKKVGRAGYKVARTGANIGYKANRAVGKTVNKFGRQVYRAGKLGYRVTKTVVNLPKTVVAKTVATTCAAMPGISYKSCEKTVKKALNGMQLNCQ